MSSRRFVLLDRDGTIIVEKDYLSDPDDVELVAGAAEALRRLASLGLGLVVVTNQSGIGRGYFDMAQLDRIHGRLREQLAREGVRLDGIYSCPHHPDAGCGCRKPGTGLVERAAAIHGFDPRASFVVGDLASDLGLGRALGATTLLVRTGHGARTEAADAVDADLVVDDLGAAAERIEALLRARDPEDPMLSR
jgi:D-glycero-D-manno-heptose 1,7-bisphosphate phosphatase